MKKDYTWGDILITTCRKMFLNKDAITVSDLPDLVDDRNYATYINMAPDVMNELMEAIHLYLFLCPKNFLYSYLRPDLESRI